MPPSARQRNRYRRPQRGATFSWLVPVVVVVLVGAVVLAIIRAHSGGGGGPQPVPASVLTAVTQVPESTWDAVGAAGLNAQGGKGVTVPVAIPAAKQPKSAPTFLYIGAEYCPYCAATRWALVTALSRFGTLSDLQLTTSSATDIFPSTPTFTFVKATYQSSSVTLQTVELQGNVAGADGSYPTLQTPTSAQQALLTTYDATPYVSASAAGSIPFILVGGKYLWVGSLLQPGLLTGLTWSDIAGQLAAGTTNVAKAILGNANELSAAICAVNGGQPAAVCGSPGVKAAAATLPAVGAA